MSEEFKTLGQIAYEAGNTGTDAEAWNLVSENMKLRYERGSAAVKEALREQPKAINESIHRKAEFKTLGQIAYEARFKKASNTSCTPWINVYEIYKANWEAAAAAVEEGLMKEPKAIYESIKRTAASYRVRQEILRDKLDPLEVISMGAEEKRQLEIEMIQVTESIKAYQNIGNLFKDMALR
jgi:hypothetical protein